MYTRFIEFYRFDLSGDSIHTLNYIVSGSLDLDHPAVLFLADRQDIRRIEAGMTAKPSAQWMVSI